LTREEFEQLVAEEFPTAVPEQFRSKIKNVAFLIEDMPSESLRSEEGLEPHMTLLGHYRGIPHTARGDYYGVSPTLPDTITLFAVPILEEADSLLQYELAASALPSADIFLLENSYARADALRNAGLDTRRVALIRQVIRDTIWHEVAHHFGMDESAVRRREQERQKEIY
jgi:predicted Zn-dependent protease with MMP-like domain